MIFRNLNYSVFSLSRVLLSLLLNSRTLLSYANFIGSGSTNVFTVILSTLKTLQTSKPSYYLHSLLTIQSHRFNRSCSCLTLLGPPSTSDLKTINRSFRFAAPQLWKKSPRLASPAHSYRLHPLLTLLTIPQSLRSLMLLSLLFLRSFPR